LERSTIKQYRQHEVHILAAIDGGTKLSRLSKARCEQLRDDLVRDHSRPMARKILQSFRSIISDATRRGLIAHDVAAGTVIARAKRHGKRLEVGVDVPTPIEVKAMIDAAADQPKALAFVCLAALAGLRASELRGLSWSQVALGRNPTVTVKERADRWSTIGSPKSETSQRTVPLGGTTVRALKAWKLAQPPGRALVFGTGHGKPDQLANLRRRLLAPLLVKAGVRFYSPHSLRHYAVSSWLASGIDPKTVQHWAGHATLALTLDTYGHMIPRPDDHQRIAAAESALLGT
jgi:integrase